jgi:hypothetical protein
MYSDVDGRVNKDLQSILASKGVKFDKAGRPILQVEIPRPVGDETNATDTAASSRRPPEAAIADLRKNPETAEDFTKMYPAYPASIYLQKK